MNREKKKRKDNGLQIYVINKAGIIYNGLQI